MYCIFRRWYPGGSPRPAPVARGVVPSTSPPPAERGVKSMPTPWILLSTNLRVLTGVSLPTKLLLAFFGLMIDLPILLPARGTARNGRRYRAIALPRTGNGFAARIFPLSPDLFSQRRLDFAAHKQAQKFPRGGGWGKGVPTSAGGSTSAGCSLLAAERPKLVRDLPPPNHRCHLWAPNLVGIRWIGSRPQNL